MTLADNYNLRASQASFSDIASFVDNMENVQTYTPTYTYNGTSITLHTLAHAEYCKLGDSKAIWVSVNTKVTLVGSAAFLDVTLPFASRGNYRAFDAMIAPNNLNFEACAGVMSNGTITIMRSGAVAYSAGIWDLYFQGVYFRV